LSSLDLPTHGVVWEEGRGKGSLVKEGTTRRVITLCVVCCVLWFVRASQRIAERKKRTRSNGVFGADRVARRRGQLFVRAPTVDGTEGTFGGPS